jgi:hypothetical protein
MACLACHSVILSGEHKLNTGAHIKLHGAFYGSTYIWAWAARPNPTQKWPGLSGQNMLSGRAWAGFSGPIGVPGRAWVGKNMNLLKARPDGPMNF